MRSPWLLLALLGCADQPFETASEKSEHRLLKVAFSGDVIVSTHLAREELGIHEGDRFDGFYIYDLAATDTSPTDPTLGHYEFRSGPSRFQLELGGYRFGSVPRDFDIHVNIIDGASDAFTITSHRNRTSIPDHELLYMDWQILDPSGYGFQSDKLIDHAPPLDRFTQAPAWTGSLMFYGRPIGADTSWVISGNVTAVNEVATDYTFGTGADSSSD